MPNFFLFSKTLCLIPCIINKITTQIKLKIVGNLNNLGLEYYNKVNESFYNIKYYLSQSIQNIDNEINKCVNISYETIINKYKTLSEEEEPFNVEFSKNEEEQNQIDEHFTVNNNETYFLHAQMKNLQHYANFKFEIEFEDNDYRKPKIVVNIINKSKPKNMILDISLA